MKSQQGISFNKLVITNFLSFGANPTTIDLRGNQITVVLGLNHDTGGDESRNGVGKSSIVDALSYAFYGKTTRGISNTKLVNKLARKGQGMLVVVELDSPNGSYRIERGESPSRMKLFRKELDNTDDFLARDGKTFIYDVSRNKNETTKDIEDVLGFDIKLFEFLIANTSETIPFMKLEESKRREIAERLMGLNLLTQRAKELAEERKEHKKNLIAAESALQATQQANLRIERQITELVAKEAQWNTNRDKELVDLEKQIAVLDGVDVDEQIEILEMIEQVNTEQIGSMATINHIRMELRSAQHDLKDLNTEIDNANRRFAELGAQKASLDASECPTCHQHWVPDPAVVDAISKEIDEIGDFSETSMGMLCDATKIVETTETAMREAQNDHAELDATMAELKTFPRMFSSIKEASGIGAKAVAHKHKLNEIKKSENPHTDTITGLRDHTVKAVDSDAVDEMTTLIMHYNYLIDLLQNKDSFLRKAVIDRWLPKLNQRIAHYLDILELPYRVRIENDLTMSIQDFGESFDWGNLSKGQRQRVTIALNLSFQDLFEATNQPLSLLLVDELLDAGICARGAQQAVAALRETVLEKNKRIFLITHRMDVVDQIDDVMLVEMKNKISYIEDDD